jgi:hypothetical protein
MPSIATAAIEITDRYDMKFPFSGKERLTIVISVAEAGSAGVTHWITPELKSFRAGIAPR